MAPRRCRDHPELLECYGRALAFADAPSSTAARFGLYVLSSYLRRARHHRAARELAEDVLDSRRCLTAMLAACGY